MIPDRRGDATNVEFVLLHIAGVSILLDPVQLCLQLLQASNGIRSQPLEFKLAKHLLLLVFRHIGQHDLADGRAVQRNTCPDPRVNAQLFGRIEFLDINRG